MDIRCVETVSGVVYEREYFRGKWQGIPSGSPRPLRERFANEEERKQHGENMSRKRHTQLVNANFEPGDIYATLTFDREHEVHDFEEGKRLRDNFVRRLKYKYPKAVIFVYMGRGSNGNRIHFHALIKGVPAEYVLHQWPYGKGKKERKNAEEDVEWVLLSGRPFVKDGVRLVGLDAERRYNGRNHGADYTALANYLFDHWTEEQGGHRWKMTRNALQPEREEDFLEPEEVRRQYNEDNPPPAPRGYIFVESRSTSYGYLYFKYVRKPLRRRQKQAGE